MGYEPKTFSCTIVEKDNKSPEVFLIFVGIVFPFLIMTICYALIFYKVRSTGRQIVRAMTRADATDLSPSRSDVADAGAVSLTGEQNVRRHTRRREQALTRTLVLICVAYFVCFLPGGLVHVFNPMPPCYNLPGVHVAASILFWCSAFVNPLIYTCTNKYKISFNIPLDCYERHMYAYSRQYRDANIYFLKKAFCCRGSDDDQPGSAWMGYSSTRSSRPRGESTRLNTPKSLSRASTPRTSRQATPRPPKRAHDGGGGGRGSRRENDMELDRLAAGAEVCSAPDGRGR